jgi:intracellular multiplication protein IcmD
LGKKVNKNNNEGNMSTKKMILSALAIVGGSLFAGIALADPSNYVALTTISKSVDTTVGQLATVMVDIALIAGICFIMAAFFKIHQHKQNPQQVQLSQGISLLLIGAGLTMVPLLIPTASVAVLGTQGSKPAQIGGSSIHDLIGGGS